MNSNPTTFVVIGGGIAGVSTSLQLAKLGYKVICLEKAEKVGLETSFLNGSLFCPSLTLPWCSVANLKGFMKQSCPTLVKSDNSVRMVWSKVALDKYFWRWVLQFTRYAVNEQTYFDLFKHSFDLSCISKYSMDELNKSADNKEHFKGRALGSLQLFQVDQDRTRLLERTSPVVKGLQEIMPAAVPTVEPILNDESLYPGGAIYSNLDSSYDIHALTQSMFKRAAELGVTFRFNCSVESLILKDDRVHGLKLNDGSVLAADAVVVASGNNSNSFALQAGDGVHSWPVRGFALEVPLQSKSGDEKIHNLGCNVVDDPRRVYIAPLTDSTIRLSGFVEFGALFPDKREYFTSKGELRDPADREIARALLHQARGLLPKDFLTVDPADPRIRLHTCWRPQTPDDLPVVGRSARYCNLYYNSGHGHLGLTRAMGTSHILAQYIHQGHPDFVRMKTNDSGDTVAMDMHALRPNRFQQDWSVGSLLKLAQQAAWAVIR